MKKTYFTSILLALIRISLPLTLNMERQKQLSRTDSSYLLVHKIKRAKSVSKMLEIMPSQPSSEVVFAALNVCGKEKDLNTALTLLECNKSVVSEAAIALVISIAGSCGDYRKAVGLLRCNNPSIASYHSCLAACSKAGAWVECLEVYQRMPELHQTTLSANIVLSSMAKANRGIEALDMFQQIKNPNNDSRLRTLCALIGMNDLEAARQFQIKYGPHDTRMLDRLTSAYAKACNWTIVEELNAQRHNITAPKFEGANIPSTFQPWHLLPKLGKGKQAFWKIGNYRDFVVALRPNRNPSQNGIKLILLEPVRKEAVACSKNEATEDIDRPNKKIGYLLMQNTADVSTLLGIFVDPLYRKNGLSKIFLAVWMQLCLEAGLLPFTGVMNKPLICLTLQHTFQYRPMPNQGVMVHLSRGSNGEIVLYSPTKKSIAGAFSPSDVKREGLVFATEPPSSTQRTVRVGSSLRPPNNLQDYVDTVLGTIDNKRSLTSEVDQKQKRKVLKTILCGL